MTIIYYLSKMVMFILYYLYSNITEIRIGNSVLVVSGYFKQDTTATAADKMLKVLEAEAATQKSAI